MRRVATLCIALTACGKSAQTPHPPPPDDTIAFVDVTVIPMLAEPMAHATVVVRGGQIVAVGPAATTPVGGKIIDGRGKWLIPGLADMHVHTFDPRQLALFVTMGVTTIRVMWGDPATIGMRDAIQRGDRRLAPMVYTAGEIIDGKPPIWPGSIGVANAAEATAAVERQHVAGYDYVKVYSLLPKDAYDAIVATAARLRMPVIGHVPYAVGLGDAFAAKQKSIEHLEGYAKFIERDDSPVKDAKEIKLRMTTYKYADDAKLVDAVARTVAAGTYNCPTLVVLDAIGSLDHPNNQRPELALVPKSMIATWAPDKDFRVRTMTAEDFVVMRGKAVWAQTVVKRLADAGAPILAGTDVGNPWLVPGYSLHDELAMLVRAKLTPMQALAAATTTPAKFFGTSEGSITVGNHADLVLLDKDPLADISNTRAIAGVMLRGRWLPEAELAAERDRIKAIYAGGSRFPDAAPVAGTFTARYRSDGMYSSGEERASLSGSTLIGETRNDGEPDTRWELELGKSGLGDRLYVAFDGLNLTMTRAGDHAHIAGKLGEATIELDEPLATDELLGGAPLAVDAAWIKKLEGDTVTLKVATLMLRPFHVEHLTITATRQPDRDGHHVYRVKLDNQSSDIVLDADGWPLSTSTLTRI